MEEPPRAERPRASLDFIPLGRAAAMVHERLFPGHPSMESKTLDVIALAMSALVPLYRRDMESGAVHAIGEADLAQGRFTRGGTTLEFPNRPALRHLVVARDQAAHAAETIAHDSVIAARLGLTARHSAQNQALR